MIPDDQRIWSRTIPHDRPRWSQMSVDDPRWSTWSTPNVLRWSQTISDSPQWSQMISDDFRRDDFRRSQIQMFSDDLRWSRPQMIPDELKSFQMIQGHTKWSWTRWSQMIPDPNHFKWPQMITHGPRWSQMIPDYPRWSQMIPGWSQMISDEMISDDPRPRCPQIIPVGVAWFGSLGNFVFPCLLLV